MGPAGRGYTTPIGDPLLPPTIRACLFDLDGVLTSTASVHAAAWKEMFDAFLAGWSAETGRPQAPFDETADYLRYVDGRPRIDGVQTFLAARDIELPLGDPGDPPGPTTVHGLSNWKNQLLLHELGRGHVDVFDDAVSFVRAVRDRHRATAVVSSSANTRTVLAVTELTDLFDVVVDGVTIGERHLAGKPAPDSFLAAAADLGVEPAAAAVFEDAIAGVTAGCSGAFGLVVGVDRVNHGAQLREAGADIVVRELTEIRLDG